MATKRKKKQQEPEAAPKRAKPRKRAKKKKAPKRRAASSSGGSKKRATRPLQLVLRVQDIPINSPALSPLSDAQRVDLAAMNPRKTLSTRPAWAADETVWRKAVRVVGPHWKRLQHPWPVVAWAYLRMEGTVIQARGFETREQQEREQRGRKRTVRTSQQVTYDEDAEPVRVERLHVDAMGIDENGNHRGKGIWWRVWNTGMDSVVRAATAAAARAIVTGRAH